MNLPRILALMGSGETAPTMVSTHRSLVARLGGTVSATVVDTPYGFQENAPELAERAVTYFSRSVNIDVTVAGLTRMSGEGHDPVSVERGLRHLAGANWVFAGPGSPTYALRQWRGTAVHDLLAEKLRTGGVVTFASAAALTVGSHTVPVYEIYKVGEVPRWLEGMDVMGRLGFNTAVVPHYDNAEGGTHDTRFCYLGERRLSMLERELPDDAFVLGVDSHTALVMDLDAGTATVLGLGGVTVRVRGTSVVFPTGTTLTLDALRAAAAGQVAARAGAGAPAARGVPEDAVASRAPSPAAAAPLLDEVHHLEREFESALDQGDVHGAVRAILGLESTLVDWSADTGLNDQTDQARSILQALIVRLGELSDRGVRDPRELVGPFVEALLELRRRARDASDWSTADLVRDRLVEAGVEVRDTADGTEWEMRRAP